MIDYSLIAKSIEFYESAGFKRIESPWTVTRAVSDITKPSGAKDFEILGKNKVLTASAEQGFLYLYLKGFLPRGQFQSVTPCFRDESFDNWHTKYFIKNELIKTDSTTFNDLDQIINLATILFGGLGLDDLEVIETNEIKTHKSYDILSRGIEVGSYGIRECDFLTWIYGTGIAEPRTSSVLKLK